jgi:predicted dehydrogenase
MIGVLIEIVVVEKPFVPTHKEAEELVGFAQKYNKLLAVYQSETTFDPNKS